MYTRYRTREPWRGKGPTDIGCTHSRKTGEQTANNTVNRRGWWLQGRLAAINRDACRKRIASVATCEFTRERWAQKGCRVVRPQEVSLLRPWSRLHSMKGGKTTTKTTTAANTSSYHTSSCRRASVAPPTVPLTITLCIPNAERNNAINNPPSKPYETQQRDVPKEYCSRLTLSIPLRSYLRLGFVHHLFLPSHFHPLLLRRDHVPCSHPARRSFVSVHARGGGG